MPAFEYSDASASLYQVDPAVTIRTYGSGNIIGKIPDIAFRSVNGNIYPTNSYTTSLFYFGGTINSTTKKDGNYYPQNGGNTFTLQWYIGAVPPPPATIGEVRNFPANITVAFPGTATDYAKSPPPTNVVSNVRTSITYNGTTYTSDDSAMKTGQTALSVPAVTDASGFITCTVTGLGIVPGISQSNPYTTVSLTYKDKLCNAILVDFSGSGLSLISSPPSTSFTWKSDRFDLLYNSSNVVPGNTYQLRLSGTTPIYSVYDTNPVQVTADASNNVSFTNLSLAQLTQGSNSFRLYDVTAIALIDSAFTGIWNIVCFRRDTKILTFNGSAEEYVPIQNIRAGDRVKTLLHGYVKVDTIGKRVLSNPGHGRRTKERLYQLTSAKYPELFEDLFITGCHSVLVDTLTEKEREAVIEQFKYTYVTDRKYRLAACVDERAKPFAEEGEFEIWHLALENEDYYMNYGIYANGLLVETASKRMMRELSDMVLM